MKNLVCPIVAAFALGVLSLSAHATLQDVKGTVYNFDSSSGLYWLDLSATRQLSSSDARDLLSPYGWSVATFDQINSLLIENLPGFVRDEDFNGGVQLSSEGADDDLLQLIGVLGGPSWSDSGVGSYELYANTGASFRPGWQAFTCLSHYSGMTAIAHTFCAEGRDKPYAETGTWMVAVTAPFALPELPTVPAVPEPSTAALALGGLLAFGVMRRMGCSCRIAKPNV